MTDVLPISTAVVAMLATLAGAYLTGGFQLKMQDRRLAHEAQAARQAQIRNDLKQAYVILSKIKDRPLINLQVVKVLESDPPDVDVPSREANRALSEIVKRLVDLVARVNQSDG
jgi:hypothetical protein